MGSREGGGGREAVSAVMNRGGMGGKIPGWIGEGPQERGTVPTPDQARQVWKNRGTTGIPMRMDINQGAPYVPDPQDHYNMTNFLHYEDRREESGKALDRSMNEQTKEAFRYDNNQMMYWRAQEQAHMADKAVRNPTEAFDFVWSASNEGRRR
jgi:hypothetical protein